MTEKNEITEDMKKALEVDEIADQVDWVKLLTTLSDFGEKLVYITKMTEDIKKAVTDGETDVVSLDKINGYEITRDHIIKFYGKTSDEAVKLGGGKTIVSEEDMLSFVRLDGEADEILTNIEPLYTELLSDYAACGFLKGHEKELEEVKQLKEEYVEAAINFSKTIKDKETKEQVKRANDENLPKQVRRKNKNKVIKKTKKLQKESK